jgi:hypothetical protein
MHPTPKGGSTYEVPSGVVYAPDQFSPRAAHWANTSSTTGAVHVFHGEYWGNWMFAIESHQVPVCIAGVLLSVLLTMLSVQ